MRWYDEESGRWYLADMDGTKRGFCYRDAKRREERRRTGRPGLSLYLLLGIALLSFVAAIGSLLGG